MKKEVLSFPNFLVMNTELGYPILLCKGKVRIDSLFTYTQPGTKLLLSDMMDSFDLNPSSKWSPSSRVGRFLIPLKELNKMIITRFSQPQV